MGAYHGRSPVTVPDSSRSVKYDNCPGVGAHTLSLSLLDTLHETLPCDTGKRLGLLTGEPFGRSHLKLIRATLERNQSGTRIHV